MYPRLLVSASWVDRGAGLLRYRLTKAWVPRPGNPTSTRILREGEMVVRSHVDDEELVLGEILYALSIQLSTGAGAPN